MMHGTDQTSWFESLGLTALKLGFTSLLILSCFAITIRSQDGQFQMKSSDSQSYDHGQSQYSVIKLESEHPQYGKCWTNALTKVTEGCKRLTDDEQSRMAIALTNCHLEKAGIEPYPCMDSQSATSCLSPMGMDIIAFNAYTNFFTHTQNICFFLQNQVWHEKTEQTVSKLAKSSEVVADQLEVTSNLQSEMMKKQNASIQNQEVILKNEEYLREALKSSADGVQDIFEEMKSSTNQQKLLFDKTFERVADIQRLILGEFTWIHSLLFYMAAVVISYLVTSTPRTSRARLWMFLVFLLSWLAERAVFSWYEDANEEAVYENLWFCRKIFFVMAIIVLIISFVIYKDYNEMNHKLLLELHEKVGKVVREQSTMDSDFTTVRTRSLEAVKGPASLSAITSPYSEDHDITFIPNKIDYSSDSDTESFVSAMPGGRRPSRPTTPSILGPDEATLHESAFNNTGIDTSKMTITSPNGEISVTLRKRGRPKGSKNSPTTSPLTRTSFGTPYNLRNRRSHASSPNPVLDRETVDMFIQTVESGRRRRSPANIKEID